MTTKHLGLALLCTLTEAGCSTQDAPPSNAIHRPAAVDEAALVAVLKSQSEAWNEGDIERFMASGYVQGPKLSFSSGGVLHRGYAATLARYRKRYASREAMGELTFSDLEVTMLGPEAALVLGRWSLLREKPVGGLFSLVMIKTKAGWRILHDHTSVSTS